MNEREDDGMELDRLRRDRVWHTLRTAEPRLDDMTRARMLAGIRQRLAEDAEEPLVVPTRSRVPWLLGAAALVATAAVVISMWKNTIGDGVRRGAGTASLGERAIIAPYLYEGDAGYPLDRQVEALSLSADAVVRARLGDQGRITVRGPATLAVAEHASQGGSEHGSDSGRTSGHAGQASLLTRLRMQRGVLVVDYQRQGARTLAIETDDTRVLVTGTVFAVEAMPGTPTRVSVYRGTVLVGASDQARIPVSAGQSWRVGQDAAGPMDPDAQALMAEHDQAPRPPAHGSGTLRIEGAPHGAVAWLGAQRLGQTPLVARLDAGPAELRIAAPGYRDVTLTAEVRDGEASSVAHGLTPEAPQDYRTPGQIGPAHSAVSQSRPGRGQATAPAPQTAEDLYRAAEAAIARGERAQAQDLLQTLIARHPADDLVDVALYELGRLAFDGGDLAAARRHVDEVLARDRDPVFREPAAYLRCRVDVAAGAIDGAIGCLSRFRQRYPQSPHDAAALALLAALQHGRGRCDLAVPLLTEYVRRYAAGPFATEAAERLQRCQP
jgi:TolA-binding protein